MKLKARRCTHLYPAKVIKLEGRQQARCQKCGTPGPLRRTLSEALRALREMR